MLWVDRKIFFRGAGVCMQNLNRPFALHIAHCKINKIWRSISEPCWPCLGKFYWIKKEDTKSVQTVEWISTWLMDLCVHLHDSVESHSNSERRHPQAPFSFHNLITTHSPIEAAKSPINDSKELIKDRETSLAQRCHYAKEPRLLWFRFE